MLSLIVLAAGKSTRMRGRNKLLANIEGKPMIRRAVETALNSKVDEVIVVLGWEAQRIREVLSDLPCRFVLNKDYEHGQSSSVKAGLKEVGPTTRAILILPGDMARIDMHSINAVLDAYNKEMASIVVAAHKAKLGHPILLSRELFQEIGQIDEQTFGLKSVVKRHETEMRLVETGTDNVLRDVDTPDDLKRIQENSGLG
jgi:molybdenum cofactor cytidylyltransferase